MEDGQGTQWISHALPTMIKGAYTCDVCLQTTPLQKESQVRFEIPEEIPVEHEYMMEMLPENQKIKNF